MSRRSYYNSESDSDSGYRSLKPSNPPSYRTARSSHSEVPQFKRPDFGNTGHSRPDFQRSNTGHSYRNVLSVESSDDDSDFEDRGRRYSDYKKARQIAQRSRSKHSNISSRHSTSSKPSNHDHQQLARQYRSKSKSTRFSSDDDYSDYSDDDRYSRHSHRSKHSTHSKHSKSSRDDQKLPFKNIIEEVMAAFGLVAATKRGRSSTRSAATSAAISKRSQSAGPVSQKGLLRAACNAAIVEAWRSRGEYEHRLDFTTERLTRIATAAIAAGGIDAIIHRDSNAHDGPLRRLVESALTGLRSSGAIGHRIRPRMGLPVDKQVKFKLMSTVAGKLLDSGFGPKDSSLTPTNKAALSSNKWSALVRTYAPELLQ